MPGSSEIKKPFSRIREEANRYRREACGQACFFHDMGLQRQAGEDRATGRRENYHIQRRTVMERYRSHLILVKAHQEPDTDVWIASIHVQF